MLTFYKDKQNHDSRLPDDAFVLCIQTSFQLAAFWHLGSGALSQHLHIISYYIIYLWFLTLKLIGRPKHVKYIMRQLLLVNSRQDNIDEPAKVCFDWLTRYTYASADP